MTFHLAMCDTGVKGCGGAAGSLLEGLLHEFSPRVAG